MINNRVTSKKRDVGLAENKYLKSGEFEIRQTIAQYIREIANRSRIINQPSGWEKLNKRGIKLHKQADRFESCGSQYLKIGCKDCQTHIICPKRCEVRICTTCAKKYNYRIRKRQSSLIKQFPKTKLKRWMMLTVTKKVNKYYSPTTSDAKDLFKQYRKLSNKLYPKSQGCGSFAVLEVGQENNLHIHALVYGYYVPQSKISKLWLELTGDSKIVDIQEVKNQRHSLNYILKYLTKPIDKVNPEKLADYTNLLLGLRRIRTYGILYNYPLAKKDSCPCPFCGGKFGFIGFESGRIVRIDSLFFDEAVAIAKLMIN